MLIAAKACLSPGVDVSDDFAIIHIDLAIATSADHFGEVVAPCVVRCFATVRQATAFHICICRNIELASAYHGRCR
jgi:hypothetical protein